jgi:hypothetical protein
MSIPATTTPGTDGCAASRWAQCGGRLFTGCTQCVSGTTCRVMNEWYSQCL